MAVNGIEIEVGQVWRTRGGEEVVVTNVDNHPIYPVKVVDPDGDIVSYTSLGFYVVDDPNGTYNFLELIRPTQGPGLSEDEKVSRAFGTIEAAATTLANATQVGGTHYKAKTIQPWDYIVANGVGFLAGNVIKYVTRYKDKNGIEDLKKARHYLDKLIETEGGAQ